MNQMWPTPPKWPPPWERCTCGCDPCRCEGDFRCSPEWMEDLLKCWKEIAKFKHIIEQIIKELNMQGSPGAPGAQGPIGPQGPAGPAGLDLAYVGPTAPPNPQQGELWMDTTNQNLNVYETGTGWVDVTGKIPVPGPAGPAGAQGAQGPAGPQGPVGAQGPAGPAGPGLSLTPGSIGAITSYHGQALSGANNVISGSLIGLTGNYLIAAAIPDALAANWYYNVLQRIS